MPLDDRGMWVIEGWEAGKKGRAEKHLHTESEKTGTIEKEQEEARLQVANQRLKHLMKGREL